MNKFKLGQRISSPHFGDGVVKAVDDEGNLCVEFDVMSADLHSCDGACKDYCGWYFDPITCENAEYPYDRLTPIGPYEGERVTHAEYGAGTIVETETGFGGKLILVQFDKMDRRLHGGNGYCRGTYLSGTCWSFAPSGYGTFIKPLSEAQPAPATIADVERLLDRHVEEYHKPAAPVIPEGWTAIDEEPEPLYDVELMLKDGTQRYGFLNNGRCVLYAEGSKPNGVGKDCVYDTKAERTVIQTSDILAWRPITAEPAVPGGWNAGHPENTDNVEIIFADGQMSVGFFGAPGVWFEFQEECRKKAANDLRYFLNSYRCTKPVIGWRVPKPEPEPFKRGERVVDKYGVHGTFVAYENDSDSDVIIMLDEGNGKGWRADFYYGKYGQFRHTTAHELKREAKNG